MADFKLTINKVLHFEGGFVNDPNDNGGETYCGISRKFWPDWGGWPIIDTGSFKVGDLVQLFYKINFWDKIGGDKIADQSIADLLMDSAVNEGIVPAVKRAQSIVNVTQDGIISDTLISKLNSL